MSDPNRAVPFIALNGCLREDFLQRVLQRALAFVPKSSSPNAAAITAPLKTMAIPGFRQASRAPLPLQARGAVSQFRASGAFVGSVLEVWLEASAALAGKVEQFLEAQDIPRDRVQADAGEFHDRWLLDDVLALADRFREGEPAADRDEVALLLCCLTSRAPLADAPETASPEAPPPAPAGEPAEAKPAAAAAPAEPASPPSAPRRPRARRAKPVPEEKS